MRSQIQPQKKEEHFITRLLKYSGPALIVSVAYMDPGNYGTDLAGGARFNYDLLWLVWLASLMAMLFQYLSGKFGIATGRDLAEQIRLSLGNRKEYTIPYWLASEVAIASTDLAEYLGTVLALNILFGVPLLIGSIFGALDVLIILAVSSRRFRVVESLFALWVSIIGLGFLYELFVAGADPSQILIHSVYPDVNSQTILVGVGIIGATVMPHAVYVHSWLTKSKLNNGFGADRKELMKLHLAETAILLGVAALVNVAIMVLAASVFYPNYSNVQSVTEAYHILRPLFGPVAATIFGVTLLASGLSSSITGTLSGQAVMEGLLGARFNPILRRLVTRFINVIPTTAAILLGFQPLQLLVYSQVILSLMLPLPMLPLVIFTSKRSIMGEFTNGKLLSYLGYLSAVVILALNAYLLYTII
ncbi:MAG: Nramp family divalent metal transporter [Conexivisphaerales archaeon]